MLWVGVGIYSPPSHLGGSPGAMGGGGESTHRAPILGAVQVLLAPLSPENPVNFFSDPNACAP